MFFSLKLKFLSLTTLFLSVFFTFNTPILHAQEINLKEIVELFISLDIIAPDKAELARSLVFTAPETFNRNLKMGDFGEDVREMQKILNSDPRTQIAVFGPGSPKNETTYFGTLTRNAVTVFQELYTPEILSPLGLIYGTGFVGRTTRAKLNSLIDGKDSGVKTPLQSALQATQNIPKSQTFAQETKDEQSGLISEVSDSISKTQNKNTYSDTLSFLNLSISGDESGELALFYPSRYEGSPNDTITLSGSGFTSKGNRVNFGNQRIDGLSAVGSSVISFSVPNVSPGRYMVSVSNNNGTSNTRPFHVVMQGTVAPSVKKITPSVLRRGDTVIIEGNGFTLTGNIVHAGFEIIEGLSSKNGTLLSFILRSPYDGLNDLESQEIELWFYVENNNGFSGKYTIPFKI